MTNKHNLNGKDHNQKMYNLDFDRVANFAMNEKLMQHARTNTPGRALIQQQQPQNIMNFAIQPDLSLEQLLQSNSAHSKLPFTRHGPSSQMIKLGASHPNTLEPSASIQKKYSSSDSGTMSTGSSLSGSTNTSEAAPAPDVKRQKRLQNNRAASSQYRKRQKERVVALEKRNKLFEIENQLLRQQLAKKSHTVSPAACTLDAYNETLELLKQELESKSVKTETTEKLKAILVQRYEQFLESCVNVSNFTFGHPESSIVKVLHFLSHRSNSKEKNEGMECKIERLILDTLGVDAAQQKKLYDKLNEMKGNLVSLSYKRDGLKRLTDAYISDLKLFKVNLEETLKLLDEEQIAKLLIWLSQHEELLHLIESSSD